MPPPYRDEHEAALQRAEALEQENARLRRLLEVRTDEDLHPAVSAPAVRLHPPHERRWHTRSAVLWAVIIAVFTAAYYVLGAGH